ncbi:MAG: HAMP domain-containing protein [Nitrospiraceae bacterium]|nr:MAG: HAMP domain-containing protein [Nitrospiraceae bacterium]
MKLRSKITLLTIAVAVSVSFFILLSIRGVVINAFRTQLVTKALSIAGNLSDRVANDILRNDYFHTNKAFKEVLGKEKELEYIFVLDNDGNLFAHTFNNGYPPDLLAWNPLEKKSQNIQLLETEKGNIRDVGVSVFKETGSELHIGIREDSLKHTLMKMSKITFPLIILFILLGIVASFVFSLFITGPLNKFVEFTKVLGRGEFGKRVEVSSEDEIGYLARSFNTLSMQMKTAREKMEEAYTYTHLMQAEKLSSIGQISAGLAHELKNPLTTLKMLFQAFREQPDMTVEDAEVISREINKMEEIISDFMGFVQQKGFKFSETDINELIDRVLSLATYDIENARIEVKKDMLENLPHIRADRALLEHVFLNLILNAVDSMPEGGEIRISGTSDERYVEIMIWDKGSGIPPDVHAKIFDPFFTTKTEGTGLGLSIAYNIVTSHGGKLFFNSEEGKGTVFTVRLPKEGDRLREKRDE